MEGKEIAHGSRGGQPRRNIKSEIGKAWLEWVAIGVLLFAIVRIVSYIGIGFDPHHDFHAFAPGLYVSEGLQPHKDFYTHYGPIDAAFKGVLIAVFGKSLYSLRLSLLMLNFVGLLSICYLTKRSRYERIWLLTFIAIWASFDPSSGASGATSYWHHLGWSSDVAIFFICILCLVSYWYWRFNLSLAKKLSIAPPAPAIGQSPVSNEHTPLQVDIKLIALGIAQGLFLSFIFFTKFTIGLSALVAILCSNISIKYLIVQNISMKCSTKVSNIYLFSRTIRLIINSLFSRSVLTPIIGIVMGVIFVLVIIGGPDYIVNYINDTFLGQYQAFTGGAGHRLLGRLLPVIATPFAAVSILVSILVLTKISKLQSLLLLAAALILGISSKAFDLKSIAMGTISHPHYTDLISYSIAGIAVLGSFLLLTQSSLFSYSAIEDTIYPGIVLPVGLLSLAQFYPVVDPFHVWWAVGTTLPLTAFVFATVGQRKESSWNSKIILTSLSICCFFTSWSFVIHAKNLTKYDFQEIQQSQQNNGFLKHIWSADHNTIGLLNDARLLVEAKPNTIILEAGPAVFVDLMNSPAARKSLSSCRIKPLNSMSSEEQKINHLLCLQKLKDSGWPVSLTNNNIQLTSKTRMVQDTMVIYWAVLEPTGKTPIPETFKSNNQELKYNNLPYWTLN